MSKDKTNDELADAYALTIPRVPTRPGGGFTYGRPHPLSIECRKCHQGYRATSDNEQARLAIAVDHLLNGDNSHLLCAECNEWAIY